MNCGTTNYNLSLTHFSAANNNYEQNRPWSRSCDEYKTKINNLLLIARLKAGPAQGVGDIGTCRGRYFSEALF